jgi:hypothetical protein
VCVLGLHAYVPEASCRSWLALVLCDDLIATPKQLLIMDRQVFSLTIMMDGFFLIIDLHTCTWPHHVVAYMLGLREIKKRKLKLA